MTMSERDIKSITATILGAAMAPEIVVTVRERSEGNLRFANGEPTTTGEVETLEISVSASIQGRSATVIGNRSDKDALRSLVAEAEELAAMSPVDPEHVPPVGKGPLLQVDGHDPATAKLDAKQRLRRAEQAIAVADAAGLGSAGFFVHHEESFTVATSAGAFCHWPSTQASLSVTCRSPDGSGSGWAAALSHLGKRVEGQAVAELAAEKADMSREPQTLAPGKQLVILEAQAVGELLSFLVDAFDARACDEGRSLFSRADGGTALGEQLFAPSIRLRSNPADGEHPARPFADDGQAHQVVDWIAGGVVKNLACSRFWAERSGAEALPLPNSLQLEGSDLDLLSLVRDVDRGVLVTRFWYNRLLDRKAALATGLTRDGTFLVEQGKITTAVKNFRYNDSPVTLLKNVVALGRPQRVAVGARVMVVPPMVVRDFNFASGSDAI